MHTREREDFQKLIDCHIKNNDLCELKDLLSYVESQVNSSSEALNGIYDDQKSNSRKQNSIVKGIGLYSLAAAFGVSILIAPEEIKSLLIILAIIATNLAIVNGFVNLYSTRTEMHLLRSNKANSEELNNMLNEQARMIQGGLDKITSSYLGEKKG
ncbi:hypothetical protein VCHA53O466_50045 [Vibrio chagasii]|nr:hypothetical protein VCHA53O466_50045 [Vibrio chagasii]